MYFFVLFVRKGGEKVVGKIEIICVDIFNCFS